MMIARSLLIVGALCVPLRASAGCETDNDCKGDRVCNAGACEEPLAGTNINVTVSMPESPVDIKRARASAQAGFWGAGATLALGLGSAATNGETFPSLPLGTAALVTTGVTFPMAAKAGGLVGDSSVTPLAIAGYTLFGLSMVNGGYLVGLGIADAQAPTSAIVSTTILGAGAGVLIGLDAHRKIDAAESGGLAADNALRSPAVGLVVLPNHLGVAGSF